MWCEKFAAINLSWNASVYVLCTLCLRHSITASVCVCACMCQSELFRARQQEKWKKTKAKYLSLFQFYSVITSWENRIARQLTKAVHSDTHTRYQVDARIQVFSSSETKLGNKRFSPNSSVSALFHHFDAFNKSTRLSQHEWKEPGKNSNECHVRNNWTQNDGKAAKRKGDAIIQSTLMFNVHSYRNITRKFIIAWMKW